MGRVLPQTLALILRESAVSLLPFSPATEAVPPWRSFFRHRTPFRRSLALAGPMVAGTSREAHRWEASPAVFLPRPELTLMCLIYSRCLQPGSISSKAEHQADHHANPSNSSLSPPAPLPWEGLSAGPWDPQQLASLLCGCLFSGLCPQRPSARGSPQPACPLSLTRDSGLRSEDPSPLGARQAGDSGTFSRLA